MRTSVAFLLGAFVLIAPTHALAQSPEVISTEYVLLNDDVSCTNCSPWEQTWELRITYRISETCTRVDAYQTPCPEGCSLTFVGSTTSGDCGGATLPVATVEVSPEEDCPCVNCPTSEQPPTQHRTITLDFGGGCTYTAHIHCVADPVWSCNIVWEIITPECFEIEAAKPSREGDRLRTPSALAFSLSSRNPTAGPVVFHLDVPESFRGAGEELAVFDLFGRRVRTLTSGAAVPGLRARTWDLRTDAGLRAQPGIYYARYRLGNETRKQTVVVVK